LTSHISSVPCFACSSNPADAGAQVLYHHVKTARAEELLLIDREVVCISSLLYFIIFYYLFNYLFDTRYT